MLSWLFFSFLWSGWRFLSLVGRLHAADRVHCLDDLHLGDLPPRQRAAEHLPETFTEMLGDERVDNGVEAGVGVSHQVGQDAEDVGGVVEGEASEPHAEDDQVMGEPAQAEEDGDDDDHFSDFTFGSPRFGHVLHGVHAGPQVPDGASVGEAEHKDGDEVAKDEGADVHYDAWFELPGRNTHHSSAQVHLSVVAEIRSRENQGQSPNQTDGGEGVLWCSHLPGAERVADGQIPARTEGRHDPGVHFLSLEKQQESTKELHKEM